MMRVSLLLMISITLVVYIIILGCNNSPYLSLVSDNQANASIVIPQNPSPDIELAAKELQHYIQKMSNANLPILNDVHKSAGNVILIGDSKALQNLNNDLNYRDKKGILIKSYKNALVLNGNDEENTLFAVYMFLEKYLGIRWFWPGELGEIVPKKSSIIVSDIDLNEEPDFKWRNRGPGGALWGATSGPTEMHVRSRLLGITGKHQDEVRTWERRNKWGGLKIYGGHALGEIFPPEKYAKTHPQFYALVDGSRAVPGPEYDYKHEGQICTTNPEVIQTAVEWARNFFSQHPDYDGVHMTLNDGRGFCECKSCQELDTGDFITRPGVDLEEMKSKPTKYTVITDRVFTFMNQVCQEVQRTHPGKYIVSMAYSRYTNPPKKIKIHPYVIPQYCLWSAYKHANPDWKQKHEEIVAGWTAVSSHAGVYEYHINGSWPGMHRYVVPFIANSIKYLSSKGIKLYQTQSGDEFAINGLNYYVAGKLLWDVSLELDEILNDFYDKAFSGAGYAIRNFHRRLDEVWINNTKNGQDISCSSLSKTRLLELFTPELLDSCRNDLNMAEELTNDEIIRKRINFFKQGLKYTELTVMAVRAAKELEAQGIKLFPLDAAIKGVQNLERDRAVSLTKNALNLWEERNSYVESIKNEYVLAYFWVKYNDVQRKFNPTENLKKLLLFLKNSIKS